MKYYRVTVLRGHSSSHPKIREKKTISTAPLGDTITFNIAANSLLEACDIARHKPSVKHNNPQAIQKAVEISYEEFKSQLGSNAYEAALGAKYKKLNSNKRKE